MTVGAERGEIAEVGSPVDVPADAEGDARRPLLWTSGAIAVATLLLGVADTGSMTAWLDERAPTPMVERLRTPITRWDSFMRTLHLTTARARLHAWSQGAHDARFGRETLGEPGAS